MTACRIGVHGSSSTTACRTGVHGKRTNCTEREENGPKDRLPQEVGTLGGRHDAPGPFKVTRRFPARCGISRGGLAGVLSCSLLRAPCLLAWCSSWCRVV